MDADSSGEISEASRIVIDSVIPLTICIVGTLGNILAVFVITVLKEYLKSATHWYILHLAVADMIFLLSLPLSLSEIGNNTWPYSEGLCKLKQTALFLSYYASCLFLMVMSLDRYIAVCKSFSPFWQKLRKRGSAIGISICIWLIALSLCIPVIMHSTIIGTKEFCRCRFDFPLNQTPDEQCQAEKESELDYQRCLENIAADKRCISSFDDPIQSGESTSDLTYEGDSFDYSYFEDLLSEVNVTDTEEDLIQDGCVFNEKPPYFVTFIVLNFCVLFILPFLIMVLSYGLIIRRLKQAGMRSRPSRNISVQQSFTSSASNVTTKSSEKSRSDRDRRRITNMCIILVTTFVICWLPYYSLQLSLIIGISNTKTWICRDLRKAADLLAFLNSALNPFLYTFLGTNFSRRWRNTTMSIRSTFTQKRPPPPTTSFTASKRNRSEKAKTKIEIRSSTNSQTRNNIDVVSSNRSPGVHSQTKLQATTSQV